MSDYLELDVGTQPPPTAVLSAHNVDLSGCEILERHQQDYFMDLFWLAYHINFPIVDEDDLRRLYASLWDPDGRTRRPDPLVDIVLALNIQYAFSFLGLGDPTSEADHTEMAVAGSPFYHRCQDALDHLMESPSITTVQCVFFSAVYLSFARCYNAAHTTLNKASHIASTLAVDDAEPKTIELLTQMRRCMRTLDVRLSIKLGRFTPDRNTPMGSDSDEPLVLDAQQDWTIYHKQMLHLCEVAADVYRTFMHCCNTLFDTNNGTIDFYTNPTTRNTAAKIMSDQIRKLHDWAAQVPPSLRTPRLSGGTADSFSTHRSPCDFTAHNVPQWLQRQRLALECQYHDFCVSLLRLFIHFAPTPDRGTFAADDNCISCVNHAVLLTNLIAQATHETDILKGCYQAFEWQQNAAYALAGFAAGYPVCPPTPSARKALGAAREMFQSFGTGNSAAVRMAALSGELDGAIAGIVARFKRGMGLTPDSAVASAPRSVAVHDIGEHTTTTLDLMGPLWDGVDVDASHLWGLSSLGQDIWETLPTDLDLGSNPT